MSDGFYSTDWDNQDQSQNQYANQSYDPSAAYNQSYDQSAYNPAQYSGQSYQPGSFSLFFNFRINKPFSVLRQRKIQSI